MADDQYTHDFEVRFGPNGDQFIEGEVEFNTDNKASYRISDISEPINKESLDDFSKLVDVLKDIYHRHGGFTSVEVKIPEEEPPV